MRTLLLLVIITICYSAYNLLIKISTNQIASPSTPPIIAAICLQAAALLVSTVYLLFLVRQNASLALPMKSYGWAIAAGFCIGAAEVLYFYLFRGFPGEKNIAASTAIPFIVGGTIVIVVAVSHLVLKESLNGAQWAGVALAFAGMIILALSSN